MRSGSAALLPIKDVHLLRSSVPLLLLFVQIAHAVAPTKPNVIQVKSKVHYLMDGILYKYQRPAQYNNLFSKDLRTYCFAGERKGFSRFFETVELRLNIENDDYSQYYGDSPDEVQAHYDKQHSLFSFNLLTQKHPRLRVSPFLQSCLGIETQQNYSIQLFRIHVDFWRVLQLALGFVAFMYAEQLSRNTIFYYMIGILAGICFSFMLVIYLCSKLIPRRSLMYGALVGGWAVGFYLIQLIWDNVQLILIAYKTYVFWYIVSTGFISFVFCYRWGPPTNNRSKNIVKWLMQFVALLTIYLCSYYEEIAASFILMILIFCYFPRSIVRYCRMLWYRRFPPKPRLISMTEFHEQGITETNKALEELRTYVSSPECKQWKLMTTLKDPLRFASFAEGASHLDDSEVQLFQSSKSSESDHGDEEEEPALHNRDSYRRNRRDSIVRERTPASNDLRIRNAMDVDRTPSQNSRRAHVRSRHQTRSPQMNPEISDDEN